ncbi:HAD domain-containing protein [Actinoplanes sp. NPDC048796]|uniref:HAD domain-containing protein n=1 Tax=Actinoplanes sp. NPDC048796 TaxID=3155640 RepID=UPI0033D14F15
MTLLFLDVDGPLLPFTHRSTSPPDPAHPLLQRLNPADGPRLLALGCDLIWATTWMSDANDLVAPRLSLPPLPVLDLPAETTPPPLNGLHWKTPYITAQADGRPFVWLDDEISETDRWWTETAYPGPALLHRVDPHVGLAEGDFAAVRSWVDGHR